MDQLWRLFITYGSWVVFWWILLDLTVVPFPSEILLLIAGSLSASGHLRPGRILLAGLLGALVADHLWFYLGRRRGSPAAHFFCRLTRQSSLCHGKTLAFFARFGPAALRSVHSAAFWTVVVLVAGLPMVLHLRRRRYRLETDQVSGD